LLREESYKRLFIRKWMMKGESEEKIRKRGAMEKLEFDHDACQLVSEELGFTDEDSLEKLVQMKIKTKEIPKNPLEKMKLRDKTLRFLISKGHDFSEAKKAVSKFFNQKEDESFD